MKLKATILATSALFATGLANAAEVDLYGQVNKLFMHTDNGVEKNSAVVDNDTSSTRFGLKAQQQLENGLVVSALLELESQSNSSNKVKMVDDESNEEDSNSIAERHSRIGLGTKYGTFLIGKTSTATDGIAEVDLGGVKNVMYSDINSIGGAMTFQQKDGTDSTIKVSNLFSNLDGGRTNLVRYDSPIINGVQGSASVSSGGDTALSAKYTGKLGHIKVKGGLGYTMVDSDDKSEDSMTVAFSALCEKTGLGATVSYGEQEDNRSSDDYSYLYTKLSYLPTGSNFEYAIDYTKAEHSGSSKAELKEYGAGLQYNIAKGVSTSFMYRTLEADKLAKEVDDIQIMTAGLKVKF